GTRMIRRAALADTDAVGRVFVRARDEMTYLPRIPDADRPRLGSMIVERHEVWVAEEDGHVVGFIGLDPEQLEHLYVDPDAQGRGIGGRLFAQAQRLRPSGVGLW